MKTLKMGNEVIRKSDSDAHKMVRDGSWKYCPKSEFKKGKVSKPVKIVKTPDTDAKVEVLEVPKTGYKGSSGRGNKEAKDAYRAKKKGKGVDVKPAG